MYWVLGFPIGCILALCLDEMLDAVVRIYERRRAKKE